MASTDHTARVCVRVSRAYTTPGAKWPGSVQNPGEGLAGPRQRLTGLILVGTAPEEAEFGPSGLDRATCD